MLGAGSRWAEGSRSLVHLKTPPVERIVPARVFDAFGWCESDTLDWCSPAGRAFDASTPVDGASVPGARMVFVFTRDVDFLPRELARLHAFGLGLTDEWALAPWAIDDATDELYARRERPRGLFWLAADNLNALFWGLHDWAHFHNHGPFVERAYNELQCDTAALAWIGMNRDVIPIDDARHARLTEEVRALSARRFADEGIPHSFGAFPRTIGS
jgi:hypothetical protein